MTETDRTIAVTTGSRAEYGLLKSSLNAIKSHDDLSLAVVATGMHLSPRHGMTVQDIRDDGFNIAQEVLMQVDGDSGTAMAKSVGVGVMGLADAFKHIGPDVMLVLGDRVEALAGTVAAVHMNIPVAHIHGGDTMRGANIDDSTRHAITKFAHLHFPASSQSADRIEKLGEEPWRITTTGAPGLDDILRDDYESARTVCARHGLDTDQPIVLVVQHPVTTNPERAGEQMARTLDAVGSFAAQTVVIYPNSDAGSDRIINVIQSRADNDDIVTFRTLPRHEYLGLMEAADVMVGNSSSGIIEAPSLDLPVVDIGPRQANRERAANTVSVPHDREEIENAIHRVLEDKNRMQQAEDCANPYEHGGAGKQICQRLVDIELSDRLLRKELTF